MDLNTILNAALTAAVAEVTAPMLSRIASLESRLFAMERVADAEPPRLVEMSISGFDDLAARIAASQLRINALFSLLSTVIVTDDDAIDRAKTAGEFSIKQGLAQMFKEVATSVAQSASEAMMEEHLDVHDHNEFYTDSDVIFDDIESKVEDKIEETLGSSSSMRDAVRTIIREEVSFSVSVD